MYWVSPQFGSCSAILKGNWLKADLIWFYLDYVDNLIRSCDHHADDDDADWEEYYQAQSNQGRTSVWTAMAKSLNNESSSGFKTKLPSL